MHPYPPSSSQSSDCEDHLSSAHKRVLHRLALGFRAGLPLRSLLDSANSLHGSCPFLLPSAQDYLLSLTLDFTPSQCPPLFSLGSHRNASLLRLMFDELDHTPSPSFSDRFLDNATAFCTSQHKRIPISTHVVFQLPSKKQSSPRQATLNVSTRLSDTGRRVWAASLVLYAHAVFPGAFASSIYQASVLELGAGTGLSAAAFEEADVRSACLTDCDPAALHTMKQNSSTVVSYPAHWLSFAKLDIGEKHCVREVTDKNKVDVVVAADVVYDPDFIPAVVDAFENALKASTREGYLFATSRTETSDQLLNEALGQSDMQVAVLQDNVNLDCFGYLCDWHLDRVRVFRLRTNGSA